jgi:rare lipoprotein A
MAVAVAAAGLGVGYFASTGDERAVNTTSRAAPAPAALARPAAASRVAAPARPLNTAPSAGADSAPAVQAATTPAPSETGLYAVQIAAVPTDREAERLLGWLADKGYSAYLEPTTTGRGRLLRVRVGPLPSLEAAQGVAAQLGEAGYAEPWITGGDVRP